MARWSTRTVMQLLPGNNPFFNAGTAVCDGTACNANDVLVPGQQGSFLLHPLDAAAAAIQASGAAVDSTQNAGRWITDTSQPFTFVAPTRAG
jgi:hypothetical protein